MHTDLNSDLKDQTFPPTVKAGDRATRVEIPIPDPHLWSLEELFLYEISVSLTAADGSADRVKT